jgi:PKHD-type hydroxylase
MILKPIFYPETNLDQTNYYWFEKGFSSEEVDKIVKESENFAFERATTVGDDRDSIRKSRIKWLPYDGFWEWVIDRLSNQVQEANNSIWKFDLSCILDNIQYTEYEGNGGHYDWHLDIGPGGISHRKVSIVVQLSDPSEYQGGVLQIKNGTNEFDVPLGKGNVVIFPSFLLHRVTPLTSGNRKSLVLWVGGGHYK